MTTYVINLPRSLQRWQSMEPVLAAMGFPEPIRWEGVDGSLLDEAELLRHQREGRLALDLEGFRVNGRRHEIGCALSHLAVIRDIVERNLPAALILEDDIALAGPHGSWRARFQAAFRELPTDWDLWYLYRCLDVKELCQRVSPTLLRPFAPLGCAAYALTARGARALLSAIEPVSGCIDGLIVDRALHPGRVKAYASSPMLVLPGQQPSIINSENSGQRWVESGINRPPEYWPDPLKTRPEVRGWVLAASAAAMLWACRK